MAYPSSRHPLNRGQILAGFISKFKTTEEKQALNLKDIKLIEERGIKKLSALTEIPLEKLSQKERLKASRVRETMAEQNTQSSQPTRQPQLQLIVPFSPILKSSLQRISYCLIDRPTLPQNLNNEQIKKRFVDLVETLRRKMALPESFRNLYSKNGKKLSTIVEVIEGDYTFFLTPLPSMDLLFSQLRRGDENQWRFRFMVEVF